MRAVDLESRGALFHLPRVARSERLAGEKAFSFENDVARISLGGWASHDSVYVQAGGVEVAALYRQFAGRDGSMWFEMGYLDTMIEMKFAGAPVIEKPVVISECCCTSQGRSLRRSRESYPPE